MAGPFIEERYLIECRRALRPPRLRGDLSDPLWQEAPPLPLVDAVSGAPGRYQTTARVLHDGVCLYVGFFCEDAYVWGTHTRRDAAIYDQECVEVFIDPSDGGHQYFEIDVSPRNTVFDARILNQRSEAQPGAPFTGRKAWNLHGLRTAVSVEGVPDRPGGASAWRAEYAIPFHELDGIPHRPPQPGDLWRINFFRIDAPAPGRPELYAWRPPLADTFHRPWRFGWMKFA